MQKGSPPHRKPNPWIEHVRKFAKKNKCTYGCALSNPLIKKGYKPVKKAKAKSEEIDWLSYIPENNY